MNPLALRSLMMNLHIRKWAAEVTDKKALQIVSASLGADTKYDKYKKSLFVTDALLGVDRTAGRLRAHFYHSTLPWADGGGRLIPSMQFRDFAFKHKSLVADFEMAVESFLGKYLDHKEEARELKGELYIEAEYPHELTVRQKFSIELITLPFPDIGDFRVEAPEEVIEELKADMAESLNRVTANVAKEINRQITNRLEILLDSLNSDKGFKKTVFEELEHALSFATSFGDVLDTKTQRLVRNVTEHILGGTPEQVRNSESLRKSVVHNLKEILNVQ